MTTKQPHATKHLSWNTHLSRTVTPEVWEWIQWRFPRVQVLHLQEVTDRPELARVLGADWAIFPRRKAGKSSTYIALRKAKFDIPASRFSNLRISAAGARFDRRRCAIRTTHRASGVLCFFGTIHTDPLGAGFVAADPRARERHVNQTRAWRKWVVEKVLRNQPDIHIVIGGDTNEQLGETWKWSVYLRKVSFLRQMETAGMKAAFKESGNHSVRVWLDDFFVQKEHNLRTRVQIRPPLWWRGKILHGAQFFDHDLVYISVEVAPR